jgi:hypothetical protein
VFRGDLYLSFIIHRASVCRAPLVALGPATGSGTLANRIDITQNLQHGVAIAFAQGERIGLQ